MPEQELNNHKGFDKALLQEISKNAQEFIGVINQTLGIIVFANEVGAKLFEYESPENLSGLQVNTLFKDSLNTVFQENWPQSTTWKEPSSGIKEFETKNGKKFWGFVQLHPFSETNTSFLLAHIRKIDQAKIGEEKLQREQLRFGALLDYVSIGVVIVNESQEIVLMNPFAMDLFGYKKGELTGKKINALIPLRYWKSHETYHDAYFAHPQNRPMGIGRDLCAMKKDGSEFPVEISLGTYRTERETFVITFVTDISKRKKNEEEIIKLNADLETKVKERTDELALTISKLERQIAETEIVESELRKSLTKEKELNELKSRFVSMASHEFRTPLSTVLSSTYLLQKYTKTEDQTKREKHIERIVSSVNMLTDILNDFLSVGKIEEGKVLTKFVTFNIQNEFDSILQEIKNIQKNGQQIHYHHEGEEMVYLDPSLLKHIVLNLLSNSIKFSSENTDIQVSTIQTDAQLTLRIMDQGVGISKEDQQHLFERFFRGSNVNAIQGTGLGLHIVQKYAELLDGTILCNSQLDKGTEFIISFSLKHPHGFKNHSFL